MTTNALNVSASIYLITQKAIRKFHNTAKQQVSHTQKRNSGLQSLPPHTLDFLTLTSFLFRDGGSRRLIKDQILKEVASFSAGRRLNAENLPVLNPEQVLQLRKEGILKKQFYMYRLNTLIDEKHYLFNLQHQHRLHFIPPYLAPCIACCTWPATKRERRQGLSSAG